VLLHRYCFERRNIGVNRDVVFCEVRIHDASCSPIQQRLLVKRERDPPDHAAIILALHQPRVDNGAGCESPDKALHPDLPKLGVYFHFGKDRSMRVHGIGIRRGWICCATATSLDLRQASTSKNIRIALAAALVVTP
jgi:hypothetical protein